MVLITTKFNVIGMSCSACSSHIEQKVNSLQSAKASVNLLSNTMMVEYDENVLSIESIIDAVRSIGYDAKVFDNIIVEEKKKIDKELLKLILSIVALVPLMIVAMGHMFSLHIEPTISVIIQIILTAFVISLNFKYFKNGIKGLVALSPNMDTLIAIGSTASVIYSVIAIFAYENYIHNLYFESAAMILTFVSVGKYFESRSKSKTTDAISKLINLSPDTTIVRRGGTEIEIKTVDVIIGDTVIIKSGDRVSVDGRIIKGDGFTDESALTGESMPCEKKKDDKVFCGTVLVNGYIEVVAEKAYEDSTLSKIISLVEEAAVSKAPIARVADTVSKFFVPTIILLSIITTLIWSLCQDDFSVALSFGIAVLVISCPCALGLATPTAIMVSTGVAASNNVLIKSSQALEVLSKTKNIVFDKTGTITEGKPHVESIDILSDISKTDVLRIAASLEKLSHHPLAHAVVDAYGGENLYEVDDFQTHMSKGISGVISGVNYKIGNKDFVNAEYTVSADKSGFTQLYLCDQNKLIAVFHVVDKIKESSIYAIKKLNESGINTYMLTGDNEDSAIYVKNQTDVMHVYSSLMPDDKEKIINELKNNGTTVMVGDGINDSPALISSDVGIAIGAGTDIAIDSADIILTKNDLCDVLTAIKLSKATLRNIRQNLFWAFIYNIIFIPIAAGVFYPAFSIRLEPMFGTIAMSMSSICVVSNALRLKFFKSDNIYKENDKEMKTMIIDGMMCMHCKTHVEKALNSIEGVSATVDLENKCANINGDVDNDILTKAVTDAGYTVISIK